MTPRLCAYCSHVPYWLASLPWPTTKSESESQWRWGVDPVITLGSWRWMEAQAAMVQAAMAAEAEARKEAEAEAETGKEVGKGVGEEVGEEVGKEGKEVVREVVGEEVAGKEVAGKKVAGEAVTGKEVTGEVAGEKEEAGTGRTQTDCYLDQETDKMKRGKKASGENGRKGKSEGGGGQGEQGGGRKREENYRQEKMEGGCHLCLLITKFTDRASCAKNTSRAYYLPPVMNPRTDEWAVDVPLVFGRRGIWSWTSNSKRKEDETRGKWDWRIKCLNNEELFQVDLVKVPGSWCPKFQPPMAYNDQNPENNVLLLKDWLENCRRNHKRCREIKKTTMDTGTHFLPTRLLDVQAFGTGSDPSSHLGDDVRLVYLSPPTMGSESADTIKSPQPYFTLSHCWGPPEKRPTTTTKANLSQRMERIPFVELPRTFQDAIEMTRKLGHRYLWIDSLCIVQDDEQDWAREASLMAKVYSHASCTLSALSSRDSSGGLHLEPLDEDRSYMDLSITTSPAQRPSPKSGTIENMNRAFASSSSSSPRFRLLYYSNEDWHTLYNGTNRTMHMVGRLGDDISPLRSRAWTLQERELSRRNIHFAKKQVLWECAELKATAQRPWHDHSSSYYAGLDSSPQREWKEEWSEIEVESGSIQSLNLLQHEDGDLVQAASAANGIANTISSLLKAYTSECDWWAMVFDYSQRLLTKDTDKLAALSGMAQFYQRNHFPCARYVAGLWSSRLKEELFWKVEDKSRARRLAAAAADNYVAPSWSWASVKGGVISFKPKVPARRVKEMRKKQLMMAGTWRDVADIQPRKRDNKDARKDGMDTRKDGKDPWKDIKDARRVITDGWEVEEINLLPKYDDPYGALKDANLIISGARLVEVELFTETLIELDPEYMYGSHYYFGGLKIDGRWVADHALDVEGEAERSGGRLWCMGMVAQRDYSKLRKTVIGGLLLREEEEKRDVDRDLCVYSRVGTFRHMKVTTFDGVKPRRIKLI
uniref:HET domain protein pin-c2 n=1 Tax=Neurospora crassa TaxID=5141 RepID=R4H4X0_NEUCS|nr:HET domain protein pin-c2 [Neurospora crassa]